MNERNKALNPKFNSKHVKPMKVKKAAQAPNIMNRTNKTQTKGLNPRIHPPKGPCPKGGEVCNCHPKLVPKH